MPTKEDGQQWNSLHKDWVFAHQEAVKLRTGVTYLFKMCQAGKGAGPTEAQLDAADAAERRATDMRLLCDAMIQKIFG